MNYETMLAASLSEDQDEKLAAHFDSYSADELAELLKTAAKKPKKNDGSPKTDTERAEQWSNTGALWGGLRNLTWNAPSPSASLGDSAAHVGKGALLGYGAGRLAHRLWHGKSHGKKLEKKSSVAVAEAWGREMAYEKVAGPVLAALAGHAISGLNKVGPSIVKGVQALGRSSVGQASVGGAVGGAVLGAGRHLLSSPDPMTGRKRGSLIGSALKGGAVGAMGGAAAKAWHGVESVQNAFNKYKAPGGVLSGNWSPPPAKVQTASVRLTEAEMEKSSQMAARDVGAMSR